MTGDGRRRPTGDAVPRSPMQVMPLPGSAMPGLTMGRYGQAQRHRGVIRVSTSPRMFSSLARKLRHMQTTASGQQKPRRSSVSSYTNDHPRIAEKDTSGVRCLGRASGPPCRRPALAIPEGRSHPGLTGPARLTCLPGDRAVHERPDRESDGTGLQELHHRSYKKNGGCTAPSRSFSRGSRWSSLCPARLGCRCARRWPACPARIYGRVRRPRGCGLPTK